MLKCLNTQRGVSVYLAIIIMVVVLSIGLGISTLSVDQIKTMKGMRYSVVAFYAADTGIEKELYEKHSPPYGPYYGFLDVDSDGTVYDESSDVCPDALAAKDPNDACYKTTVSENISKGDWVKTDEFDYWEDQTTHSFTCVGPICNEGAYSCDSDSSLRVGSCNSGGGFSEITVRVTPNTNQIQLRFQMPWNGTGGPTLYVDGQNQGQFTGSGCSFVSKLIPGMSAYTADEQVVIRIEDGNPTTCGGDSQITYLEVWPWKSLTIIQSVGVYKEVQRAIEVSF